MPVKKGYRQSPEHKAKIAASCKIAFTTRHKAIMLTQPSKEQVVSRDNCLTKAATNKLNNENIQDLSALIQPQTIQEDSAEQETQEETSNLGLPNNPEITPKDMCITSDTVNKVAPETLDIIEGIRHKVDYQEGNEKLLVNTEQSQQGSGRGQGGSGEGGELPEILPPSPTIEVLDAVELVRAEPMGGLDRAEMIRLQRVANLIPHKAGEPPVPGAGYRPPTDGPITTELKKLLKSQTVDERGKRVVWARILARSLLSGFLKHSAVEVCEVMNRSEGRVKEEKVDYKHITLRWAGEKQ